MIRTLLLSCFLLAWLCGTPGCPALAAAETPEHCAKIEYKDARLVCCANIENKDDRLRCYDDLARPKTEAVTPAASEAARDLAGCIKPDFNADYNIDYNPKYDAARLRCYDKAAGYSHWSCFKSCRPWKQKSPAKEVGDLDTCRRTCDDSERLAEYDKLTGYQGDKPSTSSYLSKAWLLDKDSQNRAGRWAIRSYQENYFLMTYNSHPDKQLYESVNPGTSLYDEETKFQLSLKMKLWDDMFGKKVDLWAAYTQLSLWQATNWNNSAPFRETNYEPELIFNVRMDMELFDGWKLQFIQIVPIDHQSNGQIPPLSRSWNRSMLNFGFERENFDVILKTWYRWPESAENDDNPDIESYLGYGELKAGYRRNLCGIDWRFSLMFRNNLRFDDENRSALQLGVEGNLFGGPLNLYVQYFTGYGESLIDYNHYTNRIGVGVSIKDW